MASVFFSFTDVATDLLSSEVQPLIKINPVFTPLVVSGSIVTDDPVEVALDGSSSATVSGLLPNVYRCEVWTNKIETEFSFVLANDATGGLTASTLVVSDFTGSLGGFYKLVPIPTVTSSGQNRNIAFTTGSVFLFGDGHWNVIPLN